MIFPYFFSYYIFRPITAIIVQVVCRIVTWFLSMNINENRFLLKLKVVMCELLREIPEFAYEY